MATKPSTPPTWLADAARADGLLGQLAERLTPHRRERMEFVLARRTRWVTLVLEDVYQPHNAGAVLRSCDGFGVQDVHVAQNFNSLRLQSNVSTGVDRWLTLYRYGKKHQNASDVTAPRQPAPAVEAPRPATAVALEHLRSRGYQLAALTLRGAPVELSEVPLDKPLALVVGTELTGLSDTAHQFADFQVRLPMEGFAQSFNLSVCAAVCLYELTQRLRDPQSRIAWELPTGDKRLLLWEWLMRDVPGAEELLERWGA